MRMRHNTYLFLSLLFFLPLFSKAQIEKVIVETYYVSDANDATDTSGVAILDSGSKTYRIFIDLKPGYRIKKIYGDANHTLKITSTDVFYNNHDRPAAYFGYLINKSWFPDNPLLALDSWITLGKPTKTNLGVLKTEDTDSSFIGGTNNFGGSAGISTGLLVNSSTDVGVPLTVADGFAPDANVLSQWLDYGFKDISGNDTTVFGPINTGSQFISNSAFLQQNSGVMGVDPDSNKVLVAQLTTKGEISFQLNLELLDSAGNSIIMVAGNDTLLPGEIVSPALTYPPLCGCKDPKYLEYNASYGCDNFDSCKTLIVCGCTDTMACNYDPSANFNLPSLCCYPGYCNDRDIEIVCPSLTQNRDIKIDLGLHPNPAFNAVTFQVPALDEHKVKYTIYNAFGSIVLENDLGIVSGNIIQNVDITALKNGLYLFRLYIGNNSATKTFIKN